MKGLYEVKKAASDKLARSLYSTESPFPFVISTNLPEEAALAARSVEALEKSASIEAAAGAAGCEVDKAFRRAVRCELVCRVRVPTLAAALALCDKSGADAFSRHLLRRKAAREAFPLTEEQDLLKALFLCRDMPQVDFELALAAGSWLKSHDFSGLTPREVPIPGFSAKWLDGREGSRRRKAVCLLAGIESLSFKERPGEVRYRYLDEQNGLERVSAQVQLSPEKPVSLAVVVENKDTYLGMPKMTGAVCVWGSGRAAARAADVLPWLKDLPRVLYWGDMDADGYEILSSFRNAGVSCESVLMDEEAYVTYSPYATLYTPKGSPIAMREPKDELNLTAEESKVYRMACCGPWRRIEQERIPIPAFLQKAGIEHLVN